MPRFHRSAHAAIPHNALMFSSSIPQRTNPWAFGTALVVNGAVLALLVFAGMRVLHPAPHNAPPSGTLTLDDFPLIAPALHAMRGGGSGGQNQLTPPIQGHPPKVDPNPILAPQPDVIDHPPLAVDPAVAADIQLPDNSAMPNIGVHSSVNVTLLSSGPGAHAGMGHNQGNGAGAGNGDGYGNGGPRGAGDGHYLPGRGGVTNPVLLSGPQAEFSDEARRNKYQGVCMIAIIVDAHGVPRNPRILQHLGMGLDEKALAAVMRYRFKPAMRNGHPVATLIDVAVDFHIY